MTMARRALVFALLFVFSAIGPASAQGRIVGVAPVIDGDTIEIHGQRIRLFGIDAPESSQLCVRPTGERWRCGQRASFALADRIGRATVSCRARDLDRYGRVVAVCFKGNEDLNRWMVANGWAVAYKRYSVDYNTLPARLLPVGVRSIFGPAASTCRGTGARNTTIKDRDEAATGSVRSGSFGGPGRARHLPQLRKWLLRPARQNARTSGRRHCCWARRNHRGR